MEISHHEIFVVCDSPAHPPGDRPLIRVTGIDDRACREKLGELGWSREGELHLCPECEEEVI